MVTETDPSPRVDEAPPLPGIVPKGSDANQDLPLQEINPLVRLSIQFFVIPMAIVVFCVALVFIFRWLTWEKKDLSAYLGAIHNSSRTSSQKEQEALKLLNYIQEAKQWQSIYDVTQELRFNREKFLAENPDFSTKIAKVFKDTPTSDHRVRQYLVQVLGLVGGPEITSVLTDALNDSDSETVIHSMIALGRIGNVQSVPRIMELSKSDDPGIRQTAVFVLGSFEDEAALTRCAEALNDPDRLVDWNAAFSLGRHHDPRAFTALHQFLDQEFIEKIAHDYALASETAGNNSNASTATSIPPERLEQYRATAVRLLGLYLDENLKKELQAIADNDKQIKVRQAAIEVLNKKPEEKVKS
jgi:HEAT repeat protein